MGAIPVLFTVSEFRPLFQLRHTALELEGKHGGSSQHGQHIRHRLRQEDRKGFVGKEIRQNIDERNQQGGGDRSGESTE